MPLQSFTVFTFASGDSTYPHSGNFTISVEGSITIDDSNGSRDGEFGDFTHTGSSDVADQDVTNSTVAGISNGDTVDSRYLYTITGSDGSSGTIYFIATNGANNYGPLFVSDVTLDPAVTYTFGTFDTDGAVDYNTLVACFVSGTQIETAKGLIAIEKLAVGDLVVTMDDGLQPIRWIGCTTVPALGDLAPICIRAGAMGNTRDLLVSPQHRMLLQGWRLELLFADNQVLATAKSLLNDRTITRRAGGKVTYFHLMFDTHQIIFAEGAPSESFHPGQQTIDGLGEQSREELYSMFPQLRDDCKSYGPSARISLKHFETQLASAAIEPYMESAA